VVLATTPPSDSPSLRPGLEADQVSPGFLGFLATLFIVVLLMVLIVDMVRRIRRVRYRAEVEERARELREGNGPDTGPGADPDAGRGQDGPDGADGQDGGPAGPLPDDAPAQRP
jgi:hypothetical protein